MMCNTCIFSSGLVSATYALNANSITAEDCHKIMLYLLWLKLQFLYAYLKHSLFLPHPNKSCGLLVLIYGGKLYLCTFKYLVGLTDNVLDFHFFILFVCLLFLVVFSSLKILSKVNRDFCRKCHKFNL